MRRITLLALVAAAGMVLASCGDIAERATEEAIERGSDGEGEVDLDFDDDGGSFSVETEDGSVEYDISGEGGGELPDDFPDVPLPDGLSIISSAKQSSGDETLFSVSGQLDDDDPQAVFEDVIADYESEGFEVEGRYENTSGEDFSGGAQFIDGDVNVSMSVFGGAASGGEGTTITFSVTESSGSGSE